MSSTTLITGGAGFIGSHVATELLRRGDRVRLLDSLDPQVHGGSRPEYLPDGAELVVGDIRDPKAVDAALNGVERVVHLAARVGVGQSMYEMADYTSVNAGGTGVLLEALIDRNIERLVVASSMSVYGEGRYVTRDGVEAERVERTRAQLQAGEWEPRGPGGEELVAQPTTETKPLVLSSVYALNKFDQERLCLLFGQAYQVPTVALRFFNVYGRYQALSNPYTGVLAIFAARLLNNRRPLIFEDGEQQRDFVSVTDVAKACALALVSDGADGLAINIGSGRSVSVNEIARRLAAVLDKHAIEPEVTGKYRVGDIRHCFADITLAREVLGFEPAVDLDAGIADLAGWLEGQVAIDSVESAAAQLSARGLTV